VTDNQAPQLQNSENNAQGDNSPQPVQNVIDNRHLVRQVIIQMLYQKHTVDKIGFQVQTYEPNPEEDLEFESLSHKTAKKVLKKKEYIDSVVNGVWDGRAELDAKVKEFATEWPIDQIDVVDLQVLRLAIYEGFVNRNVPAKVAIDEAIELARDYGTESDIQFVSGVLGNIYNKYKPEETDEDRAHSQKQAQEDREEETEETKEAEKVEPTELPLREV